MEKEVVNPLEEKFIKVNRARRKPIITTLRARVYATYEHLGTKLTIEGEGPDQDLLVVILEKLVEEIRFKHNVRG